ncbi:ABC transporter permease [Roseomonas aerophila]|uniref:ABC transporter permease n=1 Tax=Teichococcus aerophilus TaxID=1224513 RepID=A0ABR7RHE0_9PROT|nr:ABC transporter permease [Pseudoroseomonas aerophila]MBC9205582.1 ABC transporter permease [Pseudoroseomonas aerophila]
MSGVLARFGTAFAGLLVLLFFAAFAENFASLGNLAIVLKETAFLAILAIGFALALTTAELDLSIADVASLAAVATGALIQGGAAPAVAVLVGLGVGLGAGVLNGLTVTVLKVPSLIATLGMAAMAKGLGFMITQGVAFVGRWPREFTGLGRGSLLGVSNLIWWMAGIGFLAWLLLKWTRTGLHMVATGEADEAARLAGIRTGRMKRLGLALAGLLAGVTAVLLAASLSSATPNMAADHFLYAIAAVLLGMTMIEPGRPNIPGTLLAAFMLKALGNGLVLLGAPYYAQDIALGAIIIGSVALSATVMRRAAFTKKLNFRTAG